MKKIERNIGLDLVRSLAIVFVLLIHAIGFSPDGYSMALMGIEGFSRIFLRRICYTCVPLFLILSGYLNVKKVQAISTWKRAMPHLVGNYVLWSMLILVFEFLCANEVEWISILNIFNYTIPRAWYMNLYFGLLILMPFINKCWNNAELKEKRILLFALFFMTIVSKYLQQNSWEWFEGQSYLVLVSSYFKDASYIFYYLFGAYIREHPINIKKCWLTLSLLAIFIMHTGYYYVVGRGGYYNDIPGATAFWYDNPILAIESILLFSVIYDVKVKGTLLSRIITIISKCSFDMYLVSYIWDMIAYKKLFHLYWEKTYFVVLFICFAFSFTGSVMCACTKEAVFGVTRKMLCTFKNRMSGRMDV